MRSVVNEKTVKWKARDGFVCALALIILSIITNELLRVTYLNNPSFTNWFKANEKFAQGVLLLIHSSLWVLTAFVLARIRSPRGFLDQVGLSSQPTLSGWFGAWIAIGICFLALYGVAKQWIPPNQFSRSFHYQGGITKWFFIWYAVLIAPFSEEVVMRGFLYRAFRGSYNIYLSVILVLCVHGYFHWGIIIQSFYTFMCLVLVEILLCAIREWTSSVWNCVLCHAAYNATQNLPWYLFSIGLILYLPYLYYVSRKRQVLDREKC